MIIKAHGWYRPFPQTDPTAFPEFASQLKTAEMTKKSREWCEQYLDGVDVSEEEKKAMLCMEPKTGVPCAVRVRGYVGTRR